MKIHKSNSLFKYHDEDIFLFTLKNNNGVEVCISNLGAIIQSFKVQNRDGKIIDIVLGFDQMEDYLNPDYIKTGTYLGAIIGRYANRVADAKFEIDGQSFSVSPNLHPHQLHGGYEGFDKKPWKVLQMDNQILEMSYFSKDLEEGYPGNVEVSISFSLNDDDELIILTQANTDKPTAINLTHHDYFNLNGSGSISDHFIQIPAANYLGQHVDYVPNGELNSVNETSFDFNISKPIGYNLDPKLGYDQSFLLDKDYGSFGLAATAYSSESGIKLEVFTDEPTVHFYTGKYLGVLNAKRGQKYEPFTGFCFETQHHCNAINISSFPSTILRPGEIYRHQTNYSLSIER